MRGLVCALPLNELGSQSHSIVHPDVFTGTRAAGGLDTTISASHAGWMDLQSKYTFCIWHGGMTFDTWDAIFSCHDGSNGYKWQRYSSNNCLRLYHAGANATMWNLLTSELSAPGMFAARWDGGQCVAFVDGEQAGNVAFGYDPGFTSANMYFGSADYTAYLILIYNRALWLSEIRELYRDPSAIFARSAFCPATILGGGTTHLLSGWITSTADISATAKVACAVSGSTGAVTSLVATLTCVRGLSATCAGTTNLSGILTKSGLVSLSGMLGSTSALTASMQIVSPPPFTGGPQKEIPWQREALFNGMTHTAFAFGTVMTGGWFWMRRSGCSALYRGPTIGQVDFARVVAVTDTDTERLPLPMYLPHEPGENYCYVVQRFNCCGHQERTTAAALMVRIGPDGRLAPPAPNQPVSLRVEQTSADRLRVAWFYCPLDQPVVPQQFSIHWDNGIGQIDFETPLAEILYEGSKFYSHRSDALDEGTYAFTVTAKSAADVQSLSGSELRCAVSQNIPDPVRIL